MNEFFFQKPKLVNLPMKKKSPCTCITLWKQDFNNDKQANKDKKKTYEKNVLRATLYTYINKPSAINIAEKILVDANHLIYLTYRTIPLFVKFR